MCKRVKKNKEFAKDLNSDLIVPDVVGETETPLIGTSGGDKSGEDVDFGEFYRFAEITGETAKQVKEDCVLYRVKKIMERLGKVVSGVNATDKDFRAMLSNAHTLNLGQITVSPAYISSIKRQFKQGADEYKVGVIIDFPFGESLFKTKLNDLHSAIQADADEVTVVLPSMLVSGDYTAFKKQAKKIGDVKHCTGIAVSVSDFTEEQIKAVFKAVEKTNLDYVTLLFGATDMTTLREKLGCISKHKGHKRVKILASVKSVAGVSEVLKSGVDELLTPYADKIGEKLVEDFHLKNVELVR